jgi:glutamine---fructose-6-phosphate transaminase (isomerizing)
VRSLGKFPDRFPGEISGQPRALLRAADGLADQQGALAQVSNAAPAGPVVFTGMGASAHSCYPAVSALSAVGVSALHVDAAELLHFRRAVLGPNALLVVVSQSGESAEPVALAGELERQRMRPRIVSVTNGLDNTLARAADVALDTLAGPESGPSTMTSGAELVVLSGVAGALGGEQPAAGIARVRSAARRASSSADRLLGRSGELAETLIDWLGGRTTLVLLGRGPARAAAEMGALGLKEAAAFPAESLQTAQFRHGPLELAGPGLAAIVVATEPETRALDLGLARELAETGAAVTVVSPEGTAPAGGLGVATGTLERTVTPAVAVIPAQLLAWRLAVLRGRAPGEFVYATKVTAHE